MGGVQRLLSAVGPVLALWGLALLCAAALDLAWYGRFLVSLGLVR